MFALQKHGMARTFLAANESVLFFSTRLLDLDPECGAEMAQDVEFQFPCEMFCFLVSVDECVEVSTVLPAQHC